MSVGSCIDSIFALTFVACLFTFSIFYVNDIAYNKFHFLDEIQIGKDARRIFNTILQTQELSQLENMSYQKLRAELNIEDYDFQLKLQRAYYDESPELVFGAEPSRQCPVIHLEHLVLIEGEEKIAIFLFWES